MKTAVRNAAVDQHRLKRIRPEIGIPKDFDFSSSSLTPLDELIARDTLEDLKKQLKSGLNQLSEKLAAVMELQLQGFSERQIAEELDLNRGTVKSRTNAARKKLRKILRND